MAALKSDWRINMEKKITLSKQIIIGVVFAVLEFSMVVLNYKFLKFSLNFICIWTCAASFFSPLYSHFSSAEFRSALD